MEPSPILVLVRDLMFASRIAAEARAQGAAVVMLRDVGQLDGKTGELLITDLNQEGAIEAASAWLAGAEGRRVVGFVSHVDGQTIRQARDSGIREIFPRSRFFDELSRHLAG